MRRPVWAPAGAVIAGLVLVWGMEAASSDAASPTETVLTFYGIRKLEEDPKVSDADKVRAWSEFIERTEAQLTYARKAVALWKDAGRLRLIEAAQKMEVDPAYGPRQKVAQWTAVVEAYPRGQDAEAARARIQHWRTQETARLVKRAETVESEGRSKVDRIRAWQAVTAWAPQSPAGKAAEARIRALQGQLFKEAETVDQVDRIDDATKLRLWRDVLDGQPTAAQQKVARRRVAELQDEGR